MIGPFAGSLLSTNIVLFPYSTPTPTDALEIVMLSGRGGSYEAYILVRFCGDWEGGGKEGAGVLHGKNQEGQKSPPL